MVLKLSKTNLFGSVLCTILLSTSSFGDFCKLTRDVTNDTKANVSNLDKYKDNYKKAFDELQKSIKEVKNKDDLDVAEGKIENSIKSIKNLDASNLDSNIGFSVQSGNNNGGAPIQINGSALQRQLLSLGLRLDDSGHFSSGGNKISDIARLEKIVNLSVLKNIKVGDLKADAEKIDEIILRGEDKTFNKVIDITKGLTGEDSSAVANLKLAHNSFSNLEKISNYLFPESDLVKRDSNIKKMINNELNPNDVIAAATSNMVYGLLALNAFTSNYYSINLYSRVMPYVNKVRLNSSAIGLWEDLLGINSTDSSAIFNAQKGINKEKLISFLSKLFCFGAFSDFSKDVNQDYIDFATIFVEQCTSKNQSGNVYFDSGKIIPAPLMANAKKVIQFTDVYNLKDFFIQLICPNDDFLFYNNNNNPQIDTNNLLWNAKENTKLWVGDVINAAFGVNTPRHNVAAVGHQVTVPSTLETFNLHLRGDSAILSGIFDFISKSFTANLVNYLAFDFCLNKKINFTLDDFRVLNGRNNFKSKFVKLGKLLTGAIDN